MEFYHSNSHFPFSCDCRGISFFLLDHLEVCGGTITCPLDAEKFHPRRRMVSCELTLDMNVASLKAHRNTPSSVRLWTLGMPVWCWKVHPGLSSNKWWINHWHDRVTLKRSSLVTRGRWRSIGRNRQTKNGMFESWGLETKHNKQRKQNNITSTDNNNNSNNKQTTADNEYISHRQFSHWRMKALVHIHSFSPAKSTL